jgi:hypothetical protein
MPPSDPTHFGDRPPLAPGLSLADFREHYWLREELTEFCRVLGLPTDGDKPRLTTRIERHLAGLPAQPAARRERSAGPRDSDRPLARDTPVVHFKSDTATRAFFRAEIGPEFHFTYHVNQYRLKNPGLTYGDLVDEWLAERDRRASGEYVAPIASHGKYNRFVRDFFADEANRGRSLADAADAWNAIKGRRGDTRYRPGGS